MFPLLARSDKRSRSCHGTWPRLHYYGQVRWIAVTLQRPDTKTRTIPRTKSPRPLTVSDVAPHFVLGHHQVFGDGLLLLLVVRHLAQQLRTNFQPMCQQRGPSPKQARIRCSSPASSRPEAPPIAYIRKDVRTNRNNRQNSGPL